MVPYMSFLWQPLIKQLTNTSWDSRDPQLWLSVLGTLSPALQYDEGGPFCINALCQDIAEQLVL